MSPDPAPSSASGGKRSFPASAVDWAHRQGAIEEVLAELAACSARSRRRRLVAAGAAVCTLAALLGWFHAARSSPSPLATIPLAVISTPGRTILPDGSVVVLKPGSEISVAFQAQSAGIRRVNLTRGVAHFDVAKDKSRPFIVAVDEVEVRAVGTGFSIDLENRQVEILVSEGRVAIDDAHQAVPPDATVPPSGLMPHPSPLGLLDAGHRLVVPIENGAAQPGRAVRSAVTPAEMNRRLAWLSPKLEFSGTALSDAVAMFNEQNEDQFVLADPTLGRLQISGFLSAYKTDTFRLMLETNFGLKSERRGPHEIVLRRP